MIKTSGNDAPNQVAMSDHDDVYGSQTANSKNADNSNAIVNSDNIRQVTFSAPYPKRSEKRVASLPANSRNSTVVNQAANLNLNRVVLYKRGHFIETANSYFIIEISTSADGSLFIAAYDI